MNLPAVWKTRRALTVALAAFPLALTGCGGSTAVNVVAPPVPPSLVAPCATPVTLPERALTQAEVETLWGRDRSALRRCGGQVQGLAGWIAARSEAEDR